MPTWDPIRHEIVEPGQEPVMVWNLPETEDAKNFEAAYAFACNEQHNHLECDFAGRKRTPGFTYLRERYYPAGFIPLDIADPAVCKPDMPTPVAAVIIGQRTGMLLGTSPTIRVAVSEDTQETLRAVWKAGQLRSGFAAARNMAGGGSAAVLIPSIYGGHVRMTVEKPSAFRVLEWSATEPWQPKRIVRQVLVERQVRDRFTNRVETMKFWQTTEWNEADIIEYELVPETWPKDKPIPTETAKATAHGLKYCPITWYRNTDTNSPWGVTDIAGLEPRCDVIDRIGSHLHTAIGKNCDPTVWHSDDNHTRKRNPLEGRGRGVVWELSEHGSVGALEVAGTSLDMTFRFYKEVEDDTFSLANIVRVTANTAGVLKSGEAMRLGWRASEVSTSWFWPTLETAIRRVLTTFYDFAQAQGISSYEASIANTIILPSRVIPPKPKPAPPRDPGEPPDPEALIPDPPTLQPHKLGAFGFIEIEQGPYFAPTPTERQLDVTSLQAAAGGAKLLSAETAGDRAAAIYGIDPTEERRRLLTEQAESVRARQAEVAAGAGPPKPGDKPASEDEDEADGED